MNMKEVREIRMFLVPPGSQKKKKGKECPLVPCTRIVLSNIY